MSSFISKSMIGMHMFVFFLGTALVSAFVIPPQQKIESAVACDDEAVERTRMLFATTAYSKRVEDSCIGKEHLDLIESGVEDAEDAWEFLGCSDPITGDLFQPGPCGKQKPTTNCTKYQLPSFFYLGLPHAGSSSLAWQLNLHPNLSYGTRKEHNFFTTPDNGWGKHITRGDDYCCEGYLEICDPSCGNASTYADEFYVDCDVQRTFDATPGMLYLSYEGECSADKRYSCPTNYHWHLPGAGAMDELELMLGSDVKFIMIVRDPVDYLQSVYGGYEGLLAKELNHSSRTCYADYLEGWFAKWPRQNFFFVDSAEYFSNPQGSLDDILQFLGVAPYTYNSMDLNPLGRRRSKASMKVTDEDRIKFHQHEHNRDCKRRLEALTGMRFHWQGVEE